ncbi:Site-specific DNA recombinase [Rhodospirillales bacterium URHD0017]|nr:Site-specific DNA recombinase [Rhodospirillales bacterium URHD0017]
MKRPAQKTFRCAIYTRKSTEHNLDLEFNSLDAQREACEAYIKSQAHEGWRLLGDNYDDGGVSGASLERPALQELLSDIRAGRIDIVVVYKVDRLTRSLADFAKLVELFDRHAVSFVSITQSFNTTSSMGRLTLNVLLSFAQFEREVIGERVRDKIAASKRKGIWVGGPVPLGYRVADKKVVAIPDEAVAVRTIFTRYLELGSIGALTKDLDRRGVRTKTTRLVGGRVRGGIRFATGALAHLLKNRFYIGEVAYRGAIHAGGHPAIIERELFEAMQARLAENAVGRRIRLRSSPAILTGRIFDDRGNRMSPSHTNKGGVRYRYYVSHAILQRRQNEVGSVGRVPAAEIETLVLEGIRSCLASGDEAASGIADRDLIVQRVQAVTIKPRGVEDRLLLASKPPFDNTCAPGSDDLHPDSLPTTVITLPWTSPGFTAVKGILHFPSAAGPTLSSESRDALLGAIAKARRWINDLRHGRTASFEDIAKQVGQGERHIRLLAPLAFLSPRIISAIIEGTAPASVTVTGLARALPYSWAEQEHSIGL